MRKLKINKQYLAISFYALSVIIAAILFDSILNKFGVIVTFVKGVIHLLAPFGYGLFLAYLINPLLNFFEITVFGRIKFFKAKLRLKRNLSIFISFALTLALIIWFISYLAPEVLSNLANVLKIIPPTLRNLEDYITKIIHDYPDVFSYTFEDYVNSFFDEILNALYSWSTTLFSGLSTTLSYFISSTFTIAKKLLDLILGIIIAIYILADKEKFSRQTHKLVYTIFNKRISDKIFAVASDSNKVFENFLVGKILDSIIVAIICFIGLLLLGTPYALLISVIVGVTNVIPYFGPFIGAAPSVFITFIAAGFWPAIWVLIFIFVLQQIDGNIIGPKILGDSTGLGPFWIIFSITVGGAMAGVLGMFIGVPVFAVIYTMFGKFINRIYTKKTENDTIIEKEHEDDTIIEEEYENDKTTFVLEAEETEEKSK